LFVVYKHIYANIYFGSGSDSDSFSLSFRVKFIVNTYNIYLWQRHRGISLIRSTHNSDADSHIGFYGDAVFERGGDRRGKFAGGCGGSVGVLGVIWVMMLGSTDEMPGEGR
jgi:hypothetical protein